jgi:hypothetical protein
LASKPRGGAMLKKQGKLVNARKIFRKEYKSEGLKLDFMCSDGEFVYITLHIPRKISNPNTKIRKFLKKMDVDLAISLIDSKEMLKQDFLSQTIDKVYTISLESTENEHKFNITDICHD